MPGTYYIRSLYTLPTQKKNIQNIASHNILESQTVHNAAAVAVATVQRKAHITPIEVSQSQTSQHHGITRVPVDG